MIRSEGYSRSIAADPRKSLELLDVACRKIAEDTDFPDWYPELFRRRLRFNISYIAACSDPPNRELLNKVAVRGSLDRLIVDSTLSFPHWGRSLTAVWLAARMRPYSFMVAVERDNVGHGIEFVLSHQSQSIDLSSEAIVRVVQPRWVLLQRKG